MDIDHVTPSLQQYSELTYTASQNKLASYDIYKQTLLVFYILFLCHKIKQITPFNAKFELEIKVWVDGLPDISAWTV